MNCASREELLGLIDNELPEESVRDLQAHLEQCPRCREALAELQHDLGIIRDSIRSLEPLSVEIPPFEYARSAGSRRSGKPAGHHGSASGRTPIARLQPAAFLLTAAVLILVIVSGLMDESSVELPPADTAIVEDEYFEDPNTAWHQRQLIVTISDSKDRVLDRVVTSAPDAGSSPASPNTDNQNGDSAT